MPPNPVCCIVQGFLKPEEEANWHMKWNSCLIYFAELMKKVKLVANPLFVIKYICLAVFSDLFII